MRNMPSISSDVPVEKLENPENEDNSFSNLPSLFDKTKYGHKIIITNR